MNLVTKLENKTEMTWSLPFGFDTTENWFVVDPMASTTFTNKNRNDVYSRWDKIVMRQTHNEEKAGRYHIDLHERKRFKRDEDEGSFYLDLLNSCGNMRELFIL